MAQPVTIESDALRATVWPQFGGKVSSVVDKADGYELLFTYPAELPAGPLFGQTPRSSLQSSASWQLFGKRSQV